MADPGKEREYKTTDPIGASNSTNRAEPLATEEEVDPGDSKEAATLENIVKTRPALQQSKSYATTTSVVSGATESSTEPQQKPWYKNLNPMKWGAPPSVPQERGVSREYMAGFLSLMTFQWMAPLMTV
jgi:ATP-binding cassette, subfamily C (CFTR/MRP), member 1